MIACPDTNDLVATGVHADRLEDLEATNLLVDCSACGQDHEWTPQEAVIIGQGSSPTP
jgi:hypothetical protein